MELITLQQFVFRLEPFANKDLLTPSEASRLQLIITEILVDHAADYPLLKFLSRFLNQQSYDEVIEERNIEHQCGYLVCDKSPRQLKQPRRMSGLGQEDGTGTRFQIYNRKPSMILPNTYLSQYCCKEHYQASIFYRNQLSNEAIFARKDIMNISPFPEKPANWYENNVTCLEEVLARHRELKDEGKSLTDVITMMSGLSVNGENNDTSELIKLIQDFEIIEKAGGEEGEAPNFQLDDDDVDADPDQLATSVEGYITNNKCFGGFAV